MVLWYYCQQPKLRALDLCFTLCRDGWRCPSGQNGKLSGDWQGRQYRSISNEKPALVSRSVRFVALYVA